LGRGIFVTATSTGIGKTVVSAAISYRLSQDHKICYYKPVQTGGIIKEDKIYSSDCEFVSLVCGNKINVFSSYLFKYPASPHFSARLEDCTIKKQKIVEDYKSIVDKFDFVVTEGAGGLFVPLNEDGFYIYNIPKTLKIGVVLVANASLGAINFVSLNSFFLKNNKIKLASIILLTEDSKPSQIELENREILKKITKIDNIYLIPQFKNIDTENSLVGNFYENIKNFPDSEEIKRWFL